jgi:purine-binding chemotaxis protein CheW
MIQILPFLLDDQPYALYAERVERVFRAVEITPLPQAPAVIRGLITIHGRIVPVVDVRRRFKLPARELALDDIFILARTASRSVVVIADAVHGVLEIPEEVVTSAAKAAPGAPYVAGIAELPDGMIIIHDLDAFLSLEEEKALERSLEALKGQGNGGS